MCADLTGLLELEVVDPTDKAKILQLMQSSEALDLEYDGWSESLPQSWKFQEIQPLIRDQTRPTLVHPSSTSIHIYQDVWFAATRNYYRMGVIILHETLLQCARRLKITDWSVKDGLEKQHDASNIASSKRIIHNLKAEIGASISYCVGELDSRGISSPNMAGKAVGAYFMLWPLRHICNCEHSTAEQARDAGRALEYIGRVLGIKRALAPWEMKKRTSSPLVMSSPSEEQNRSRSPSQSEEFDSGIPCQHVVSQAEP